MSSLQTAVPVLMYHRVLTADERSRVSQTPYEISCEDFSAQLRFLVQQGFRTCSLQELQNPAALAGHAKSVGLTFDDGYLDNYTHAYPALRGLGLTATFFVIANKIGTPDFMTWEQLREMQDHGMSIQSHTLNHLPLAGLPEEAMTQEVRESRTMLERNLGTPVTFISFPHGSYDARVTAAARAAGYAGWCNSEFGYYRRGRAGRAFPRVIIRDRHTLADFASIVHASGPRYTRLKWGAVMRHAVTKTLGLKNYQLLYESIYKRNRTSNVGTTAA